MTGRLLILTAHGHLPFDHVAPGKDFPCQVLEPVQPAAPVSAEAVMSAVQAPELMVH